MKNLNDQIERYLGDSGIEDFESINEIQQYFSRKNLEYMFQPDIIDMDEANKVRDWVIEQFKNLPTHFIVQTAAAKMPSSCDGKYARIAVLECEHWQHAPKMISTHARGVVRIVETWERLNVGKTEKCAFRRALKKANELCAELNS